MFASSRTLGYLLPALLLVACALGPRTTEATTRSAPPVPCVADTIRLVTDEGALAGSLACPGADVQSPMPVVLLLSGSGPTDRDGNSAVLPGRNDALHMLADSLAAHGIASVRYDKRGVGASRSAAAAQGDARFDVYTADAAEWVSMLKGDTRFRSVTVVGHSEGSLVRMIAARLAGADAFVSLAGAARPGGRAILAQLTRQLPKPMLDAAEHVLQELEAGRTVDTLPGVLALAPALQRLFRPTVQPYLISWFRHDPVEELARLRIPALVVQGTTDTQVSPEDAKALAGALPGLTPLIIEGMNHVLKLVPQDPAAQARSYQDPTLPVPGSLVSSIASFVYEASSN